MYPLHPSDYLQAFALFKQNSGRLCVKYRALGIEHEAPLRIVTDLKRTIGRKPNMP